MENICLYCTFMMQIILVLKSLKLYGNSHVTVIIQIISHVLAYTNSCVNPVLYAFLSDNFRKAFRKVSNHSQFYFHFDLTFLHFVLAKSQHCTVCINVCRSISFHSIHIFDKWFHNYFTSRKCCRYFLRPGARFH